MATSEINIVIKATNQAKAAIDALVRDLTATSKVLGGIGAGQTLPKVTKDLKDTGDAAASLEAKFNSAARGLKFLTGGFLAIQAVQFVKGLADTAARTEVLGIVLNQAGQNAGYTAAEMRKADLAVQKMGITAEKSRQALTQLLQSGLDIQMAGQLARAAQDLAVVSGMNSSDTFQRLIVNIQQMDSMGLRFMGIMINREKVFADAAKAGLDVTNESIKKQVFANAVLAESVKLQGIYENSLSSAGKALTTLPRHVEALKVAIGNQLLPIYSELVQGTIGLVKEFVALSKTFAEVAPNADLFADSIGNTGTNTSAAANAVRDFMEALKNGLKLLFEYREALTWVVGTLSAVWVGLKLVAGMAIVYKFFIEAATAVGFFTGSLLGLLPTLRAVTVAMGIFVAANPALAVISALATALTLAAGAWALFSDNTDKTGDKVGETAAKVGDMEALIAQYAKQMKERNRLMYEWIDLETKAKALEQQKIGKSGEEKAKLEREIATLRLAADAVKKELSQSKKDIEKTTVDIARSPKVSGVQQERIEAITAEGLKPEKDALAIKAAQEALDSALKAASIDTGEWQKGISLKFQEEIGGMINALKAIPAPADEASFALDAVLAKFTEMTSKAKTEEDFKGLADLGTKLATAATAAGKNFDRQVALSLSTARRNVDNTKRAIAAGGQAALAEANAYSKAIAEAQENRVKNEVALLRIAADLKADQEKDAYEQGKLSLQDYYQARFRAIEENTALELRLSDAAIKKLEKSRNLAQSVSERQSITNQINQEKAKQTQLKAKGAADVEKTTEERKRELDAVADKVRSLTNDIRDLTGDEIGAAIDKVNQKYDNMLKAKGMTDDQRVAIEQLRALEVAITTLDKKNLKLEKELALRNAILDLQSAEQNFAVKKGLLTDLEALQSANAIILQRIENTKQLIRLEEESLALKRRNNTTGEESTAEKEQALKIIQLKNQNLQLAASYETLGDRIKKTFTDSLSSAYEGLLNRTKTLKDAVKGILSDVTQSINKVAATDLAQRTTRAIVEKTTVDGKSPFDFLGDLFKGAPGSSITNPMYAQIVGGLGGGVIPFGPTQDGGNLAGTTGAAAGGQGSFLDKVLGFFGIGQKKTDEAAKQAADTIITPVGEAVKKSATDLSTEVSGGSIFDTINGIFKSLESLFMQGSQSLFSGSGGGGSGLFGWLGGLFGGSGTSNAWDLMADGLPYLVAADGGYLHGPSHSGGGVHVEAEGGEFIVNAKATKTWLPLLQMINGRTQLPSLMPKLKFGDGGMVAGPQAGAINGKAAKVTVVQYITTPDVVGFRKSRDQIAAESGAAVNRAMRRNK